MNKRVTLTALALVLMPLGACTKQAEPERIAIDLGEAEDYRDFLEERGDVVAPVPFEPEPLFVNAIGKVQATPDLAVITAFITAKNKNESRAVDEMGGIINAVQEALKGQEIETGFTAINSNREFDELCLDENRFAQRRHAEIRSDYVFNNNLDEQGDTETKRRDPKPRVAQRVCVAQEIRVFTNMVIRIKPAEAAGDVLRALSDAGAENARLYGYDYTDYDALYQEAAVKAVELARVKAQTVASEAGGTLGEIESFSVSAPERQGRFGPQPNVIRPATPYQGQGGSVIDRHIEDSKDDAPRRSRLNFGGGGSGQDTIVVTGSRIRSSNSTAAPVSISSIQAESAAFSNVADALVLVQDAGGFTGGLDDADSSNGTTNPLSISLLSGPQTISVAAELGYTYETPLNGKIIKDPDDEP